MRIEFAWNHNLCNYCLLTIGFSSSKQCVGQNGGVTCCGNLGRCLIYMITFRDVFWSTNDVEFVLFGG